MEFFILGITVFGLSVLTPFFTRVVDESMDYGGILGFVRYGIARRIKPHLIAQAEDSLKKNPESSVSLMNEVYWQIYYQSKSKILKGIICIDCMAVRQNILINLAWVVSLSVYYRNIYFIMIFPFVLIFSIGLNRWIHGLLQ